jgi:hypothetical protein
MLLVLLFEDEVVLPELMLPLNELSGEAKVEPMVTRALPTIF